jgi:hypothetical protein
MEQRGRASAQRMLDHDAAHAGRHIRVDGRGEDRRLMVAVWPSSQWSGGRILGTSTSTQPKPGAGLVTGSNQLLR